MTHRAKKSLGQNFLKSKMILRRIADAGEIKKEDVILEIGPGKGALTEQLLGSRCKVLAVEKDKELYEFLKTKFTEEIASGQLILIHDDILKFEIENLKLRDYKVIANIPYNITGAILKKFLSSDPPAGGQPELMVLMLQKEVADRIVARDGKESILSISIKAYGEPSRVMKVDKRYFSPAPKVNSGIIKIANINRQFFREQGIDEEKFWEIVKKGFAHKRKKLSSNLKSFQKNGDAASLEREKILQNLGNKRAEDLSLAEWGEIVQNLCKT